MIAKWFGRLRGEPSRAEAPTPAPDAAALLAQGNAALGQGDLGQARRCYASACELQPSNASARLNLGYVLLETGEPQGAIDTLTQAIALRRPEDGFLHEALYLRGRSQQALGHVPEAIADFRAALVAQPAFQEALLEAVPLLIAQQRAEDALALAQAARSAAPSATPLMLEARALHALKRPEQALAAIDAVLAREPGHAGALETRGNLLLEVDRAQEAVADLQRVVAMQGGDPGAAANLAAALRELDRPADMVRVTTEAAQLHPAHPELQLNRAIGQLTLGDWVAGWEGFEWRWHAWTGKAAPWERWPRWQGEALAQGTVLLVCEQGLGDSIQALRYVPLVAQRVREVVLVLQAPLLPLARGLAPNCRAIALGDAVPHVDCQCPLMGLPRVFGTTPGNVPGGNAYLHADPQRVQRWQALLPPTQRPRVGLTWSGGPRPRHRSVPLALLAPLAQQPFQFVSLQPEVREEDRAAMRAWPDLFDAGPLLQDFGDTAALLECLDLVITVDTSVAHLAGALGRPVWNLLRFAPDWRWLQQRSDTPWYPSMRLYRQRELRDWREVVAQVQRDLQSFQPPRQ